VLRRMLDPNTVDLRQPPRDLRDFVIGANNSWMQAYDNFSFLPDWLSDAFCRCATGGGISTRRLYTDDDEYLVEIQRPIILNAIGEIATRSDLLDRAIMVNLPRIARRSRRTEKTFWRGFHEAHPQLLGGLLDAVVVAMRNVENVHLADLPRMADFAEFAVAGEPAMGVPSGTFLARYAMNQESIHSLALETSAVATTLRQFTTSRPIWSGTADQLLAVLRRLAECGFRPLPAGWPKGPKQLSVQLRRLVSNLRHVGIDVEFQRGHERIVHIRPVSSQGI
jgi:hypothetical protein